MTIEVRQLVIKSTVGERPAPAQPPVLPAAAVERLKEDLLAECKAWLRDRLQSSSER